MKLYLSGPMSGIKDFNYPSFIKAKEELTAKGHTVLSPHEAPKLGSWEDYMRFDIPMLCQCEAIVILTGWKKSRGAVLEKYIAENLSMQVYRIDNGQLLPMETIFFKD